MRGELAALKNDVKELTEAQHQAAHTIATMKAAEEDLRRDVPPPYWYSTPAALDLAISSGFVTRVSAKTRKHATLFMPDVP